MRLLSCVERRVIVDVSKRRDDGRPIRRRAWSVVVRHPLNQGGVVPNEHVALRN
jgi:hypothetical protein